jgi:hypothetical protein
MVLGAEGTGRGPFLATEAKGYLSLESGWEGGGNLDDVRGWLSVWFRFRMIVSREMGMGRLWETGNERRCWRLEGRRNSYCFCCRWTRRVGIRVI